jgi:hypothetical protein
MRIYKSDRYWSPTQKQLLLAGWPSELALDQICKDTGRDRGQVLRKARSFGLLVRQRSELQQLARETSCAEYAARSEFAADDPAPTEEVSISNGTVDLIITSPPCEGMNRKKRKANTKICKQKKPDIKTVAGSLFRSSPKSITTASTLSSSLPALFPMEAIDGGPAGTKKTRKRVEWTPDMKGVAFTGFDHGLTAEAVGVLMGLTEAAVRSYWSKTGLAGRKRSEIWRGEGPSPVRGAARHLVMREDKHTGTMFYCRKEDVSKNWYSPATRRSKWAKENGIAKKFGASGLA